MSVEIVGNGYTLQELQKDLSAGYQYVDLSYIPQETPRSLTVLTTDTFMPVSVENDQGKEEELSIKMKNYEVPPLHSGRSIRQPPRFSESSLDTGTNTTRT